MVSDWFRLVLLLYLSPTHSAGLRPKKDAERYDRPDYFIIPEFASGQVCTLSTLDSLICQIYYQEHAVGVAKELVYTVNGVLVDGALRCHHVPVGEGFRGREYRELFAAFLAHDSLPIALYRSTQANAAPLPYVFTCPPLNTILHELDMVFVLKRDR